MASSRSHPAPPDPSRDEASTRDQGSLPEPNGPALRGPRSLSAMGDIAFGRPGELLDTELDDALGDPGFGRSFTDDVRSDGYDDERHERR